MTDTSCVKVAVRIRPQLAIDNFDKICTTVVKNEPQIFIGKDKSFTFDEVFDISSSQEEIYNECVKDLVQGCFEGYNATVLAYGQTGSGKTYTMGTGFDLMLKPQLQGIVPRAIDHIFKEVENRKMVTIENGGFIPDIKIDAQFIELYNEDIIDLLDPVDANGRKRQIKIHEDHNGVIYCVGLLVPCISTVEEALDCLKTGSLSRTTASTQMNLQSSRSHAIFSIHIKQQRVAKLPSCTDACNSDKHSHAGNLNEFETLTAKFHFVDLAGSERLKRTQATGDRQKEGISINSGLLALGNVISALGDKSRRAMHVPYRDSKLTRLLQDSLGGNSRTLMIACISPSDRDFMETLNTLTYANRAKRIKNKVTVNMDKTSQTISKLREDVANLQLEILEYKQGKRIIGVNGVECVNDMYHENAMLRSENNTLKGRVKALLETIEHMNKKNIDLIAEKETNHWIANGSSDIEEVVKGYIKEIETLRAKLLEAEELNIYLRNAHAHNNARYSSSPTSTVAITGAYDIRSDSPGSVNELIVEAKDNVRKLKRRKKKLVSTIEKEAGDNSATDEDKDIDEKNEDEEGDVIMPEDSSSESEEQDDYSANLAGLTCEISMKEKLIRQLEMQQRRMLHMQQCYEQKIIQLQAKIRHTERERDTFNSNKGTEIEHNEKARRVNEDFECKINSLKKEMQKMEVAKKQHVNMMKNESHFSAELAKLRNELAEMKRAKVVLVNKMKEEAKKHKESEHKKMKEITQLKKDQRTKDTRIKALEAEKCVKETVLRRKQEELFALRKRNKAQNITRNRMFSPRLAKQKWQTLEKKITKLVMNKQSIAHIERDMNFYLLEREKLGRCLDNVDRKLNRARMERRDDEVIQNLEEERSNLMLNLDYAYEQINECQMSITQIDNVKGDVDTIELPDFFKIVNNEEMKYLTEKLLSMCINQSFQVMQQESNVKELEQQLQQVVENNSVQEQLLLHIIHQANENISSLILPKESDDDEDIGSNGDLYSSVDSRLDFEKQATYVINSPRKKKAREVAVTAEDILFSGSHDPGKDGEGASFAALENYNVLENFPSSIGDAVISKKQYQNDHWSPSCVSFTPPNYSHLGSLTRPVTPDLDGMLGEMIPFAESLQSSTRTYLKCTHIAEGHKDGVICIECTNDVLFSGSKDCTVKLWDLNTWREIGQLVGHSNCITKVRYCEYTRLAFTSSMASIKIWDMRQKSACIQTLRSSGVSQKGSSAFEDRALNHVIPPGEHYINDIALNHFGTALFSAASGAIRMWDLKMYQSVASLNCGFQSNISCITVDDDIVEENRVISGLTDHSIKVFEILEGSPGIHLPKSVLKPPHYDAIQALAANGGLLFSASTDACVKKWNLNTLTLVASLPASSGDWLCAFNLVPSRNLFLSGYRSGYLHLHSSDTFELIEELRAHRPAINAISSNQTSIFTASDDSTIGVWKLRENSH